MVTECKTFKTVKIGIQEWMVENLNVDHYQNGDPIPEVKDSAVWMSLKTGAWCYYNNDPENGNKYGKLYNWYAIIDPRGLPSKGWHIPKKEEFDILKAEVNNNGNALKEVSRGIDLGAGTNLCGFSALLAGLRSFDNEFYFLNQYAYFWSTTESSIINANSLTLCHIDNSIIFHNSTKECGLSVRCLKD